MIEFTLALPQNIPTDIKMLCHYIVSFNLVPSKKQYVCPMHWSVTSDMGSSFSSYLENDCSFWVLSHTDHVVGYSGGRCSQLSGHDPGCQLIMESGKKLFLGIWSILVCYPIWGHWSVYWSIKHLSILCKNLCSLDWTNIYTDSKMTTSVSTSWRKGAISSQNTTDLNQSSSQNWLIWYHPF